MAADLLLVDDDDLLRRSLAFNLEKAGFRVIPSANAGYKLKPQAP